MRLRTWVVAGGFALTGLSGCNETSVGKSLAEAFGQVIEEAKAAAAKSEAFTGDSTGKGFTGPNSAPLPTAGYIVMKKNESATVKVMGNDPDAGDILTYRIIDGLNHGTATISLYGTVTYTPEEGYEGADYIGVKVRDVQGLFGITYIPIAVGQVPFSPLSIPLMGAACFDGENRSVITAIDPVAGTNLDASTTYTFTATVSYAISNVPATVSFRVNGNTMQSTTVSTPGCGIAVLSGSYTTPAGSSYFTARSTPSIDQYINYVYGDPEQTAEITIESLGMIPGMYVTTPTLEFDGIISWDLHGDFGDFGDSYMELYQDSGFYYGPYAYPNASASNVPVKFRGVVYCGDNYISWYVGGNGAGPVDWGEQYFSFPVAPLYVSVDNFFTNVPVNAGSDVQASIGVEACDADRDVDLTSPGAWLTISPSSAFIAANTTTYFDITYVADEIAPDSFVSGDIMIEGDGWSLAVPVSARGYDIDFSAYTDLGLNGDDDGSEMATLSFDFPYEGATTTREIWVNSNNTLSPFDNSDYENAWGTVTGGYGYPIWAFHWTDSGFFQGDWDYYNGQSESVYFREVGTGASIYAEFLWWDNDSYEDSLMHTCYIVRLYPDGRVTYQFLQRQSSGIESAGVWASDGTLLQGQNVYEIEEGKIYTFDPVPAP